MLGVFGGVSVLDGPWVVIGRAAIAVAISEQRSLVSTSRVLRRGVAFVGCVGQLLWLV